MRKRNFDILFLDEMFQLFEFFESDAGKPWPEVTSQEEEGGKWWKEDNRPWIEWEVAKSKELDFMI